MYSACHQTFQVAPDVLKEHGKASFYYFLVYHGSKYSLYLQTKNPYPNVDATSGPPPFYLLVCNGIDGIDVQVVCSTIMA